MKTGKFDRKNVEILIAEDSATQREQLRGLLEARGYAVAAAANGREALKAMRRRAPTLVISDIVMPALDGYDLCRAIKSDEALKHIPVVLVTTLADALDVVKALECGADNFIRKPYDERDLLSRLEYLLMNLELRRNQKMRMGIEISLGEQRHFITAERQQLVDLLISTYEQAVRINDDLKSRERELRHSNQVLNGLCRIAEGLNSAVSQQAVGEMALERAMEIPGVQAGWISLREGKTGFRLLAARNLPPALESAGAMEGECACRRKLLTGELDSVTNILACERLGKATGDTRGLRLHASVPLWLSGETLGVMNLAGPNEGLFDESELKMLFGIGHEVAVALERARLHEHLETLVQERTAQLAAEIADRQLIQEAQARLVAILDATPDLVGIADMQGRVVHLNAAGRRMLGIGDGDDLGTTTIAGSHPPTEREQILTVAIPAAMRDGVWAGESVFLSSDGRTVPVSQVIIAHKDTAGNLQYLSSISRDITERKEQQARIERLNRVYAVLSGINTAIVRIRSRQELFDEACHIAVGHGGFTFAWLGLLDADTHAVRPVAKAGRDEGYLEKINLTADENAPGNCELTAQALTSAMPVVCSDIAADKRIKTWRDEALQRGYRSIALLPLIVDGRAVGLFVLYAPEPGVFDEQEMKLLEEMAGDISFALDHLAQEERLHHLAYFDTVTGLPNRALFLDRLGQRVIDERREGGVFSVVMLDLDRFRSVNESLGQAAGDEVLREVARRLEGVVGDAGILARVGSNAFAVVSRQERATSETARMRQPLGTCIQERPFVVHDKELRLGAKIGIALFPRDGADAETLYRSAEAALKEAKRTGLPYQSYESGMNEMASERLVLEGKLQRALENEEFVLHYQPKVALATGRIVGVEALIRWQDPEGGLVPPGKFIAVLEETGMIIEVGRWAIRRALLDLGKWSAAGIEPMRVAVNISPAQLRHKRFVSDVAKAIVEAGSEATNLELEITESLVMENIETNIHKLKAVRELGVSIVIDDFGTGYSSLSYVVRLPVNTLKIDRAFIQNMTTSADDTNIVSTIISLAHSLKLTVVAEGVETEEQRKLLWLLRCNELQGYLFSPAVPAEQLERMLREDKSLPV